jgi:hypothetical protein
MTQSVLIVLSAVLVVVVWAAGGPEVKTGDEDDLVLNKRGWKDVSGSWGKRGWNDLQGQWGKRGWDRLNGAWGKRLTTDDPDMEEFWDGIEKRPEWGKFKGSWGKRATGQAGWSNLKGLWGKRAWDKLANSWGKRSENDDDVPNMNEFN